MFYIKLKLELTFLSFLLSAHPQTLDIRALREWINTKKNESLKYCLRKSHEGEIYDEDAYASALVCGGIMEMLGMSLGEVS